MARTLIESRRVEITDLIKGARLIEAREASGLSQAELAKRMNEFCDQRIYQQKVKRWEDAKLFAVELEVSTALHAVLLPYL